DDAVLPLDHLEQQPGDDARVECRVEGVLVTECDVSEALRERREGLVLGGLTGRVQRRQRPTVERAVRRDHRVATTPAKATGELDRALVRLRARVGEEHLPASG